MYTNYEYTRTGTNITKKLSAINSQFTHHNSHITKKAPKISGLVVLTGIEPVTHGFSVRCSTN